MRPTTKRPASVAPLDGAESFSVLATGAKQASFAILAKIRSGAEICNGFPLAGSGQQRERAKFFQRQFVADHVADDDFLQGQIREWREAWR